MHLVIFEPSCDKRIEYDPPKGNWKGSGALTCRFSGLEASTVVSPVEMSLGKTSGGVEGTSTCSVPLTTSVGKVSTLRTLGEVTAKRASSASSGSVEKASLKNSLNTGLCLIEHGERAYVFSHVFYKSFAEEVTISKGPWLSGRWLGEIRVHTHKERFAPFCRNGAVRVP